jgi:hypothetical protein
MTNILIGEMCSAITDNFILDSKYFNNLSLIRDINPCNDSDLLLHKTKKIVIRDFDYIKTYDGEMKDDYMCFTVGSTFDGIVSMMTKNTIAITEAILDFKYQTRHLSQDYMIIMRNIADFSDNEIPFLPFKFGLTTNSEMIIKIKTDTDEEYKLTVLYKKNVEMQNVYLDYIIHKIYSVSPVFDTKSLVERVGNVLVNYIVSTSDSMSIESEDNTMIVKKTNFCNGKTLFKFTPSHLCCTYGLKIDKYNSYKLRFNSSDLTLIIVKVFHIS